MFRLKFLARFVAGTINAFVIILTLGIVALGVIHTIDAFEKVYKYALTHNEDLHPGIAIIDTLDIFLIALVFLIFSIGISRLFIKHDNEEFDNSLPKWLRIESFTDLKIILMEAIIAMLFVFAVTVIIKENSGPNVDWLIVPGIILLLSISLRVLKWKK